MTAEAPFLLYQEQSVIAGTVVPWFSCTGAKGKYKELRSKIRVPGDHHDVAGVALAADCRWTASKRGTCILCLDTHRCLIIALLSKGTLIWVFARFDPSRHKQTSCSRLCAFIAVVRELQSSPHLRRNKRPPTACRPTSMAMSLAHPRTAAWTASASVIRIVPHEPASVVGKPGPTAMSVEQYPP